MTKLIYGFTNKYFFEIGIFLCFVLPPIGVVLLLFAGCQHLHQVWKQGKRIKISPGLFLLICLFFSSIGAAIVKKEYSFFLVSALLLAYIGLYLKIKSDGVQKIFSSFKWITICGGIYFYALYPIQDFLMKHIYLSYFMGTALVGQTIQQNYERLMGAAYNPNLSVSLLLLGLSFLLAECLKSIKSISYLKLGMQAAVVCMFVHAILLTGSKAGFGIMFIIFILFIFRWNKLFALLLICIMGININLLVDWIPRSTELFISADIRKEIWKKSFNLWQENSLFGTTPIGFYKEYFYLYHEKMPHAHNLVLGMFTEYGSFGGIALLIVISINVYKMLSLYFSKQTNKVHLDTFLIALPVILLTGVFDYVLYSPQVALIAIILLASWDKYTARLSLVHPRILNYAKKWSWSVSIKASENKESL